MDDQIVTLIGQGGITAALLFLIWKAGQALVGSIDRLSTKIENLAIGHVEIKVQIAELRGKVDEVLAAPVRESERTIERNG